MNSKISVAGLALSPEFVDGIVTSVPVTVMSGKAASGTHEARSIAPAPRYGEVRREAIVPLNIVRESHGLRRCLVYL